MQSRSLHRFPEGLLNILKALYCLVQVQTKSLQESLEGLTDVLEALYCQLHGTIAYVGFFYHRQTCHMTN